MTSKRLSQFAQAGALVGTELVLVSQLSASVTLTRTDISAQASDNSFNTAAGDFVAAGFSVGKSVKVAGFTPPANNLFTGVVTAVTSAKLTIGGTDGDVIVDAAAGASVTITQWNSTRTTVAALAALSSTIAIPIACSDEATALTAGTAKVTFRMPFAFTVSAVRASLTTAQASGVIFTVDINEGGVSILSTKLTIDNTEKTSTTAATPPVISDSALADDAEITIDIDQIGDGTAKGLKVYLIGTLA